MAKTVETSEPAGEPMQPEENPQPLQEASQPKMEEPQPVEQSPAEDSQPDADPVDTPEPEDVIAPTATTGPVYVTAEEVREEFRDIFLPVEAIKNIRFHVPGDDHVYQLDDGQMMGAYELRIVGIKPDLQDEG
jgi:hypothetical protein